MSCSAIFHFKKLAPQLFNNEQFRGLLEALIYLPCRGHHLPAAMRGMKFCVTSSIFVIAPAILLRSCLVLANLQPYVAADNA